MVINWDGDLSNTSADLNDVTFGAGQWIAVGANGTIISSPDASVFSLRNSGTAITLNSITYGEGIFVAVGQAGLIMTSTNGESWMGQGTDAAQDLLAVTHGNGRFMAVGTNGIVHASSNGVDWSTATIPNSKRLTSVGFADGLFYTVGTRDASSPFLYVSVDGLAWNEAQLPFLAATVEDSEGTVWLLNSISGAATIAKAVREGESGLKLTVQGGAGNIVLSFRAPTPATYEILSTDSIGAGGWQSVEVLSDVSGNVSWTNTSPMAQPRFFRIMQR